MSSPGALALAFAQVGSRDPLSNAQCVQGRSPAWLFLGAYWGQICGKVPTQLRAPCDQAPVAGFLSPAPIHTIHTTDVQPTNARLTPISPLSGACCKKQCVMQPPRDNTSILGTQRGEIGTIRPNIEQPRRVLLSPTRALHVHCYLIFFLTCNKTVEGKMSGVPSTSYSLAF